ncbi:mannose-P-dolichol utilization defect 1 protein [Aplysia californica]|uniref:Mannose-P-dolichol utilization defect 1 protein n=1 Tax=Aplysia californica TaxID=6500 RepID=A0ABM1AAI0_APLCA|nr:mannose-P-dolichol utilization defect 1 protein [Aplysia californica]
MSLSGAVAAQFKLILLEKCSGVGGHTRYCLEAGWPQLDARCVFHLFTAILGYLLIVIVSLGQIPLLFKILQTQKSCSYVTPIQVCLLVTAASSNVTYAVHRHFPISTWGEAIIQLTQYVIIMNLMFVYHGRHRNAIGFMLLYIPVMVVLLWPLVSPNTILMMKMISLPVAAFTKIPYIYRRHKQQEESPERSPPPPPPSSSLSSQLLVNLGSSGRLLTAVVDTRDFLMVLGYALDSLLDWLVTSQALRHRRREKLVAGREGREGEKLGRKGGGGVGRLGGLEEEKMERREERRR